MEWTYALADIGKIIILCLYQIFSLWFFFRQNKKPSSPNDMFWELLLYIGISVFPKKACQATPQTWINSISYVILLDLILFYCK